VARVGHAFPAYVTPRALVRVYLVDAQGQPVTGSVRERVIACQVPLDLSREISDTRNPPGGRFILDYSLRMEAVGLSFASP
jgi:hypothetical protein